MLPSTDTEAAVTRWSRQRMGAVPCFPSALTAREKCLQYSSGGCTLLGSEMKGNVMANLLVKITEHKSAVIDIDLAKRQLKGKKTVFENNDRQQEKEIKDTLLALIKDRNLSSAMFKGAWVTSGYDKDAAKRSGKHSLKIQVGTTVLVPNMMVWINKPVNNEPKDVGLAGVSSSEAAKKLLKALKSSEKTLSGLGFKEGDKEHPTSFLWKMGKYSGSLPLNAHGKGPGGKNEKAALKVLKSAMLTKGFV